MTKPNEPTRRDFIRQVSAGAVAAAGAGSTLSGEGATRQAPAVSKGRVIGANDRINVGFVGCGGRMNAHIRRVMERNKERGDVQAVAVNDIWDKRKQRAREATGVDERSVYHDYREVCARPDVDVVVIASPDHWHHLQTMDALRNGKDVYLEKPMTYTVDEAREVAEAVKSSGRVLQVGSQYTSMDHFWKAKQAIKDGLLGEVVWASGGFGRNRNLRGEWNYAIDPEATDKTLDWKAFLGPAPKRAFDPERYFRWRKYWDYSGGIATDLFYHTVSPLLVAIGGDFPFRVTSSGGIYVQKDREVPDTFFMNVDYPAWTMQLACSVASGAGAPLVIHGSQATLFIGQNSENLVNTQMDVVPDAEYRDEFVKKTGSETLKIDVKPVARGAHPHMDNFLECVRSRQEPNLPARLGYQAMAAIGMGVQAYRQHEVLFFDRRREKVSNKPIGT
jgi:predicted dehydrogenase